MNSFKKKKIGIITMYHDSANYGGLLQAYALTRYLNENNCNAMQISYNLHDGQINLNNKEMHSQIIKFLIISRKNIKKVIHKIYNLTHHTSKLSEIRRNACATFRDKIPHTSKVYDSKNINEVAEYFDVFITGSDQVWNPLCYRSSFFLKFVDGKKKLKIAYAASISNEIKEKAVKVYRDNLADFFAISVREKTDKTKIESIIHKNVEWVLDPVFLIPKDHWIQQCDVPHNSVNSHYIFCYFLGDDMTVRNLAIEFAKINSLKIVTIPYMQMEYRTCDKHFGDIRLNNASPNIFLSLINNADIVFTDSFHATAFSIIFSKQFAVFDRSDHPEMSERIRSITELTKSSERFFSAEDEKTIDNLIYITDRNTNYQTKEFDIMLNRSKNYLESVII